MLSHVTTSLRGESSQVFKGIWIVLSLPVDILDAFCCPLLSQITSQKNQIRAVGRSAYQQARATASPPRARFVGVMTAQANLRFEVERLGGEDTAQGNCRILDVCVD